MDWSKIALWCVLLAVSAACWVVIWQTVTRLLHLLAAML